MSNFMRQCSFPNCGKGHKGHGLCQGHLIQKNKGYTLSDLDGTRYKAQRQKICSVDKCMALCRCKDLCRQHYSKAIAPELLMTERRNRRLVGTFGITLDQYETMLKNQNGCCKICKTDNPGGRWDLFSVDHDRSCCASVKSCGACVRGLLCFGCNLGLGFSFDNIDILANAIAYLESRQNATV